LETLTHKDFTIEPVRVGRKWVAEVRGTLNGQFVIGEAKGKSKWYAVVAAKDLVDKLKLGKFKLKFAYSKLHIHREMTDGTNKHIHL